jgi:O-Antigen ligase
MYSPKNGPDLSLKPAPAWTAILGLVTFTVVGILAGGNLFRLAFPSACFAVGVLLYKRYPTLYMGFTWWLWFLTPLIRRLVDFRYGYELQSLILMAPFLVTLITLPRFIKYLLKSYPYSQGGLPFILAFVAILYSFLMGLVTQGFNLLLIRVFIEWLAPIIFGFYIFSDWQNYPNYKNNIQYTFFWGVLVMGGYGLIQYLMMPPWDLLWQREAIEFGFGNVAKNQIWSTVNSPGALSLLLIPGLLLLFTSKELLRIPVGVAGSLAFLLTNVRSGWIGFLVGIFILTGNLERRLQIRVVLITLVITLSVFPLANMEPFSDIIVSRVETLSDVGGDRSVQARTEQYQTLLSYSLSDPVGQGMSSLNLPDSGILNLLFEMGWLGSIPFLGGLVLIFLSLFQNYKGKSDPFLAVARAIACSVLVLVPSGNMFPALPGIVLWAFASIVLAGHRFYLHELVDIK